MILMGDFLMNKFFKYSLVLISLQGGSNIPQIFDEAIASSGFIYTNAQLLQALDKKAGRTTHYHPGFPITSAQLLRAIEKLEVRGSSLEIYDEHNNEYIGYNISSITKLPADVSTLEVIRIIDCPSITTIPDINKMTNLRVIDLSGSTMSSGCDSIMYTLKTLAKNNLAHITMPDY